MKEEILGKLRTFLHVTTTPLTSHDDADQIGMAYDIDYALESTDRFTYITHSIKSGVLQFEVEWLGSGTAMIDVRRDFYGIFHDFAEETQFVHNTIQGETIVFEMILGSMEGGSQHIHYVIMTIVGERVRQVIKGIRDMRSGLQDLQ